MWVVSVTFRLVLLFDGSCLLLLESDGLGYRVFTLFLLTFSFSFVISPFPFSPLSFPFPFVEELEEVSSHEVEGFPLPEDVSQEWEAFPLPEDSDHD